MYEKLGDTFKQKYGKDCDVWLITSDFEAMKHIGLHPRRRFPSRTEVSTAVSSTSNSTTAQRRPKTTANNLFNVGKLNEFDKLLTA